MALLVLPAAAAGAQVVAASGVLEKNAAGKIAMTVVTLRPDVTFSGERLPTRAELDQLHHEAHENCFIANSVKTDVRCEPVYPVYPV